MIEYIDFYIKLCKDHPLLKYLEDPLSNTDLRGYSKLFDKFKTECPNVKIVLKRLVQDKLSNLSHIIDKEEEKLGSSGTKMNTLNPLYKSRLIHNEPRPEDIKDELTELEKKKKEEEELRKKLEEEEKKRQEEEEAKRLEEEEAKNTKGKKKPEAKKPEVKKANVKKTDEELKKEKEEEEKNLPPPIPFTQLKDISINFGNFSCLTEMNEIIQKIKQNNIGLSIYDNVFESNQSAIIDYGIGLHFNRIILHGFTIKPDKKEKLIEYLSENGACDYMAGIYEVFYKRDEIKAVETLNNLKSFYHKIMYDMASEEIKNAKESFPIITIELKDKDKCLLLNNSEERDYSKLLIISNEYKEELENLTITEGINLQGNNKTMKVKCYINSEEKYCLLDNNITESGEYMLIVPNRIQKKEYAIKVHNSTIKYYFKESRIDTNLTKLNYEIDYGEKEKHIIELHFINGPDEKVKVLNEGTELNCSINESSLQCEISNDVLKVNKDNPKNNIQYIINIEGLCGENLYSFNISVKNSNNNSEGLGVGTLLIIVIVSLLIIIIATFIIYRCTRKDIEINIEEAKEERILNDA